VDTAELDKDGVKFCELSVLYAQLSLSAQLGGERREEWRV